MLTLYIQFTSVERQLVQSKQDANNAGIPHANTSHLGVLAIISKH